MTAKENYLTAFKGRFVSTLRWHDLTKFWQVLQQQVDDSWYVYAVGETVPEKTSAKKEVLAFIEKIDILLRKEHQEDYCGIVYVDDKTTPSFVKIFDPNNLGVSCGFSEVQPLPGWILSKIPPVELEDALRPPKNRQRWWQKAFQSSVKP